MYRADFCKKWLGPLLAIAMILISICLDFGQADHIFTCAGRESTEAEAYLVKTLVADREAPCTTEQLGLKSVQAMAQAKRPSENNVRMVWSLVFLVIAWELHTWVKKEKKKNPERALARHRCVIRYIHRQDGEKWISVILSVRIKSQEEDTYGSEYCGGCSAYHRSMRRNLVLVDGKW